MAPRKVLPSDAYGHIEEVQAMLCQTTIASRKVAAKDDPKKHICGFKDCTSRPFKSNVDNERHELTHLRGILNQVLPFACSKPGCDKRFSQASHLQTHENSKTHGGMVLYTCDCGGFRAHDKSSVARHIRDRKAKGEAGHGNDNFSKKKKKQTRRAESPVAQATMEDPLQGQGAMVADPPAPSFGYCHGQVTPPLAPSLPADSVPAFKWDQYLQFPSIVDGQPFDPVALYHEALEQHVVASNLQMTPPYVNVMAQGPMMPMPETPADKQPLDSTPGEYSGMIQDHDMGFDTQYTFQQDHLMNDG